MDGNQKRLVAETALTEVCPRIAGALDASADDLRHGRVEDARAALTRLEHQLGGHLARKQAVADAAKG